MKRPFSLLVLLFIFLCGKAQTTVVDSVNLDLLNAPSNPAFNLMGISPSSIDRPTDLNAFRLSLQNATSSFTKLPSNYAIELAPAALFGIKNQTLEKFNSTKFKDYFWQSLSISVGMTQSNIEDKETNDSTSFTKLGFGLKVSLIRPHWTDSTAYYVDQFYKSQAELLIAFENLKANDKEIDTINAKLEKANALSSSDPGRLDLIKSLNHQKDSLTKSHNDLISKSQGSNSNLSTFRNNIKQSAGKIKVARSGGFLDFTTGIALDFPDNRFNNSMVSKAGGWLTGGYENGNNGLSILGIARYLYQPDKIFADDSGKINSKNISTFDYGARLVITGLQGKFSASTEVIRRAILNKNTISPSFRLVFNAEYSVGLNQKLTLAIGKNFDGTITKSGNLIAALNFIKGFGSNKKIVTPEK